MLRKLLYRMVGVIADVHERILTLNDAYEYNFSDKQLHFLVIGIVGMLLLFVIHPLFTALTRRGHILAISWLYVFTVILVLTFAIEIGQDLTNTGRMEFSDIVFGIGGFLLMFLVFAVLRALVLFVVGQVRRGRRR